MEERVLEVEQQLKQFVIDDFVLSKVAVICNQCSMATIAQVHKDLEGAF